MQRVKEYLLLIKIFCRRLFLFQPQHKNRRYFHSFFKCNPSLRYISEHYAYIRTKTFISFFHCIASGRSADSNIFLKKTIFHHGILISSTLTIFFSSVATWPIFRSMYTFTCFSHTKSIRYSISLITTLFAIQFVEESNNCVCFFPHTKQIVFGNLSWLF
jgi:hypothetical protein